MSERLDDTLRDLARADAPADLSARVRVALEQDAASAAWWPKAAAAAVLVMVAVGGWFASDRGGGPSAPRSAPHAARVPPPAVERGGSAPARAMADKEAPRRVRVRTAVQPADHEHALPSLADIAAVGPAALTTPTMSVEATEIAPLAPIAPMEIPALDAGEGERR